MVRYAFTVRDLSPSTPCRSRGAHWVRFANAMMRRGRAPITRLPRNIYVMHQPDDGHTLFVGPESAFIVNPTLYPDLRYKLTDFMPSP